MKVKDDKEWMFQAEYDLDAAEKVFEIGLYPYTIFMCHLSVEKALKAVYYFKLKKEPPRIHNLSQLVQTLNLNPPADQVDFLTDFSSMSVPARYPDDLKSVFGKFDKKQTKTILSKCKKVVKWLKKELTQKS
jgi:HEPN domain-containing protein